ncbi:MAG: hypothetical protein JO135_03030 [Candidatus Eremiobacteraeota bacterium]|nr:hypothetical protein [Candidatus Eremiobacteraeota bacterium]
MLPDPDAVRKKRAEELIYLAQFLRQIPKIKGTSALTDAATQCKREKPGQDLWGYTFGGIVFEAEDPHGVLPSDATDIRVELSMDIVGHCTPQPDPLTKLSTNIIVKGIDLKNAPLLFSWHLDRAIGNASEGDASHPRYHFQHAGTIMRDKTCSWGSAIFLEEPRLTHPPMNAFIACDFVLSNFLPRARQKLALEGNYKKWLRLAQIDLWKPYVEALANAWSNDSPGSLCRDFWPNII